MRKNKKHKKYSIEEKNQIVLLYQDRHMSYTDITRRYDLASRSTLSTWVSQYKTYGTCVDGRGKATKKEGVQKGRPKKYKVPLEELSKEQLIERVKMYENIKKSIAYLTNQQQS